MKSKLRGLYAITPETGDRADLLSRVDAALSGGCRILQYRDKLSAMPERVARARALREFTRRHGARLLINDDLALCRLVEADGVHLGEDDGNLRAARAILGPDAILGASCYADYATAEAAVAAGADYVAFGAVHPSPTKPNARRATVDLFFRAKSALTANTCAIGGITLDNGPPLIAAGADLLAVITDLFSAPDIAARAAQYQQLFERA
ncbi:thiamine phosphate synthase [Dechloromonas sp.]|uniref:thiamine phosphate synthase n=1 Tax=Dechloromonas sp. TaxID=1917218 RepID=UPI00121519C7|nr:thiamine phosphate synthase [Dechloromonas sp.]MBU3695718.1 thiamine phosphate synthase [Dechloromonas sp.]TEX46299.1 MAG: thiamine phosphate synthase [Rhodocyclaceae bacterium]